MPEPLLLDRFIPLQRIQDAVRGRGAEAKAISWPLPFRIRDLGELGMDQSSARGLAPKPAALSPLLVAAASLHETDRPTLMRALERRLQRSGMLDAAVRASRGV